MTLPLYVDDGRLYWDPTAGAEAVATDDRARLTKEFNIEFKEIDPEQDYFLGANRISSDDRGSCTLKATTYISDMGGSLLPGRRLEQDVGGIPIIVVVHSGR